MWVDKDGYAHVAENGEPHIGQAQGTQEQDQQLDPQGEDDVLADDAHGLAGEL